MDIEPKLKKIEYVIALHLQATCEQDNQIKPCQQVIQINAVLLSFKQHKSQILGRFHEMVKPKINHKLGQFCTKITGIKSQDIKNAKQLQIVFQMFQKWLKNFNVINPHNYTFLTWGNWTLKKCLLSQFKIKKLKVPDFVNNFIDLKRVYHNTVSQGNTGIFDAAKQMKIDIKIQQKNLTPGQKLIQNLVQIVNRLSIDKKFVPNRKIMTIINDLPNVNVTQDLQYLLVLDFQATCQQNIKLKPCSQIIQFPVMIISLKQNKIINQFHHYISPTYNPKLTKFCTQLTGITQQMVDNKPNIQQVLKLLDKWINNQQYLQAKNFTFVTCGDWDLSSCLKSQAKAKNLQIPQYLKNYINIKKVFQKFIPNYNRSQGMMGMLSALKIQHEGKHHSGIDDVRNICKVCIGLINNLGVKFNKNFINYVK